ncbi:hypothetical protein [Paraclostridium tenue]|uniref:Uncharacterized protein n=1 Tax=Paraclostridium tenue TaxID=1737 RepID=A0ABP3X8F3_9FIRM
MFYLLTSSKANRQDNNYIIGNELLKKIDFILNNSSNINNSHNNLNAINNNFSKNIDKKNKS